MAGPTFVYVRLWNPGRSNIFGDASNILNYLERNIDGNGRKDKCIQVIWAGATQAAAEELGTAAASVKDGTTTPFQVIVVSSQANDADIATGDARKVALIGVSVSSITNFTQGEQPRLTVEVVNLNGTSDVPTVRYYLKVIHAYVCHWGSTDDDAVGNITIESPANTTLITIAATQNESDASALYFADGDLVQIWLLDPTVADAAADAGDGIFTTILKEGFEHKLNLDGDIESLAYPWLIDFPGLGPQRPFEPVPALAGSTSSLILQETLIGETRNGQITALVKVKSTKYR